MSLMAPATRFLASGQSKWLSAWALKNATAGSAPTSTPTPFTSVRAASAANLLLIVVLSADPSQRFRSVKMMVLKLPAGAWVVEAGPTVVSVPQELGIWKTVNVNGLPVLNT